MEGLIFGGEGVALSGCQSCPERHGAEQRIELVSGVLQEGRHRGDVHVMEQYGVKAAWFKDPDGNILNVLSMG